MPLQRFSITVGVRLLSIVVLAKTASAKEDTEFAFDLFSNVAPILALFGEQFARQFMSESLTWLDHLIFAMVPLGILTVITGAIRVQGPRVARSFIGRARENRALAEIELMSSTSGEVCELFNGKSIVRLMGKPTIAQFLIFPEQYNRLEEQHKEVDKTWRDKASRTAKPPVDKSCGIHSLRTAITKEAGRDEILMKREDYHSYSYRLVRKYLDSLKKRLHSRLPGRTKTDGSERDEECGSVKDESAKGYGSEESCDWLGPPNLQLNLSSDHFGKARSRQRRELFIAAVTAVAIQTGLIAIAAVTVYHQSTRNSISSKPKAYGLPCYVAGSILLSIGMGICSLAVERNTVEYSWQVLKDDRAREKDGRDQSFTNEDGERIAWPRLVWLQQNQTVNDQAFDGYAILAGPKRDIVTSSRIEDIKKTSKNHNIDNSSDSSHSADESSHDNSPNDAESPERRDTLTRQIAWELLTVVAVLASGLGFIAQFMGLRGLAFPCSISQLIAISAMALIRAVIRRRLGRITAHCSASARYELDFLATHIVFCPKFRTFNQLSEENEKYMRKQPPSEIYQWNILAPEPGQRSPFFFRLPKEIAEAATSDSRRQPEIEITQVNVGNSEVKVGSPLKLPSRRFSGQTPSRDADGAYFSEATSQQLLRVRERLADLCKWTSIASESALSLVQSVELFMNTFFPDSSDRQSEEKHEKQLDAITWVIETVRPPTSVKRGCFRADAGKWEVDIGKVDAALSLWMASIQANTPEDQGSSLDNKPKASEAAHRKPDWRRARAGSDMRYSFYRILGDNFKDGVLKRDLSWWVDELIAEQSESKSGNGETPDSQQRGGDENSTPTDQWPQSRPRENTVDLAIGFNGRPKSVDTRRQSSDPEAQELGIVRNGYLPTILAQHLFTSFMWTIVEQLPKDCLHQGFASKQQDVQVEDHTFDPYDFLQTWHRPKLRHPKLTKIVRQMETYGLGTTTDILLCMIPALSFKDLLPNHVILRLIPHIGEGQGWAETARCYNRLLHTSISTTPEENFCYAVVVAAMDFLYFACEPYDKYVEPPFELRNELGDIVEKLVSAKFSPIIRKLAPIYDLQHRRRAFEYIFERLGKEGDRNGCLEAFQKRDTNIAGDFLRNKLGFSKYHDVVYEAIGGQMPRLDYRLWLNEGAVTPDIFGWTPIHYACSKDSRPLLRYLRYASSSLQDMTDRGVHKVTDKFKRSPIHVAASTGNKAALAFMLDALTDEDRKNAVNQGGMDGMTPLHLASRIGSHDCVESIIDVAQTQVTKADVWGREAIHIAARAGHDKIASQLLAQGSWTVRVDNIGKTALDYLLNFLNEDEAPQPSQGATRDPDDMGTTSSQDSNPDHTGGPQNKSYLLNQRKGRILVEFALKKPDYRDGAGKTFLHLAAEVADEGTIGRLLAEGFDIEARDSEKRTPLHCAIISGRPNIALSFMTGFENGKYKADVRATDERNTTALMFAARKSLKDVAERLLEAKLDLNDKDVDKYTALHHAAETAGPGMVEFLVNEGCDTTARSSTGRTALHVALIERKDDVALYLFNEAKLQDDPTDKDGNTLLVTACRYGCTALVEKLLKTWPKVINKGDSDFNQPPISWACENNLNQMVELLLTSEHIDVNQPAPGWRNNTPLHFAAQADDSEILKQLVAMDSAKLDVENKYGETPLQLVIDDDSTPKAKILLLSDKTPDTVRLEYLNEFSKSSYGNFYSIIPDVVGCVTDESLTDDILLELVNASESLETHEPFVAFVKRALKRNTWKKIKNPYHRAVFFGSLELVELLTQAGADPTSLDEDNWSCVDYARRLGRHSLGDDLIKHIQHHTNADYKAPIHAIPKSFDMTDFDQNILISVCQSHDQCTGLNDIQVHKHASSRERLTIRSKNCVPPPTSSKTHFYFEVTVLEASDSGILGLGFCHESVGWDSMPGWFEGSWAYHGDDGKLFIESGSGRIPTSDFGPPAMFGAGDTVGVCLNLETGKGFCTLNGYRMKMGDAFDRSKFDSGKMYPCIGFDTEETGEGLHFTVNFSGDHNHPFEYKGSFD